MVEKILQILNKEIVLAEGCTEPIALAYASSKLRETLGCVPEKIDIYLSGNLIKNIKSVIIPNSGGLTGIETSVAMGVFLGDSSKGLMVIAGADSSKMADVKKYVESGCIKAKKIDGDLKLHLRLIGYSGADKAVVEIKNTHLNIVYIEKNGEILHKSEDSAISGSSIDMSFLSTKFIYDFANKTELTPFREIFKRVYDYNWSIAEEGIKNTYGAAIGKTIYEGIKEGEYEKNPKNMLLSYTAAASDARMNGCSMAVTSVCGSGNQGLSVSVPVIAFCKEKKMNEDTMLRALLFSHLMLAHIKEHVGRLSAYCGVICGAAATAGALAVADNLSYEQTAMAVETTLATMSGIVCDGAKGSCAAKLMAAESFGYDAYYLAKKNKSFGYGEGIIGADIEHTLKNLKIFAIDGLKVTDEIVLDIMLNN